jgi:DNA-nicking Smr family endonuclease
MSRRRLDPDERSLWKHITRSIAPLAKRKRGDAEETEPPAATPPKAQAKIKAKIKAKPSAAAAPAAARPAARPEPAPLGRKAKRRLARDSGAIQGRLDLHGLTQAEAYNALLGFLHRSQASGARIVLVITGKGVRGDSERGVLKRQVPMWLRLPEFRDMVIGFETAAIAHGGEGAIYVRLRRARAS